MSSGLYRNFLRLLEKWPVDPLKQGRDLGEYIRGGVTVAFRGGSHEPSDREACTDIYARLNNIVSNRYKDLFYVSDPANSTGLSQADCQEAVSNEFLKLVEEENKGVKEKLGAYFKKN